MLTMGRRRYRSPQQMAAPILQPLTPREEGIGGCRRGAEIRVLHRGGQSKAFSGGRPSAGEVPQGLPRQRTRGRRGNRCGPLYPIGVVLGLRPPSMAIECGVRRGPRLAI